MATGISTRSAVEQWSDSIKIENWCQRLRNSFEEEDYQRAAVYYDSIDPHFPDTVRNLVPQPSFDAADGLDEPVPEYFLKVPIPINAPICYMGSVSYKKLADQSTGFQKLRYQRRAQQIDEKGNQLFSKLVMIQGLNDDKILEPVDESPEPVGGFTAFYNQIENQIKHEKSLVKGKVYIEFIVETDGSIQYIHVVKSFDQRYNKRVISILKTTRWVPARLKGKPVRTRMLLPVTIRAE